MADNNQKLVLQPPSNRKRRLEVNVALTPSGSHDHAPPTPGVTPGPSVTFHLKVALAFNDRRSSREIHGILCQESHEGPLQPLGGGIGALWAAPGTIEIV